MSLNKLTIICFALLYIATVTKADRIKRMYALCPPHFFRIGTQCYFISKDRVNWLDAHFECKDRNSRLAEPIKMEDKRLRQYLMESGVDKYDKWIGGIFNWERNKWQWGYNGRDMAYQSFSQMIPGSSRDLKFHCAVLNPELKYRWSARSCVDKYQYICQHRMPYVSEKNRQRIYTKWNETYPYEKANEVEVIITEDNKRTFRSGQQNNRQRNSIFIDNKWIRRVSRNKFEPRRRIDNELSNSIDFGKRTNRTLINRRPKLTNDINQAQNPYTQISNEIDQRLPVARIQGAESRRDEVSVVEPDEHKNERLGGHERRRKRIRPTTTTTEAPVDDEVDTTPATQRPKRRRILKKVSPEETERLRQEQIRLDETKKMLEAATERGNLEYLEGLRLEEENRKKELKNREEEQERRDEELARRATEERLRDDELKRRAEEEKRREVELYNRAEEEKRVQQELVNREIELKNRADEEKRREEELINRAEEEKRVKIELENREKVLKLRAEEEKKRAEEQLLRDAEEERRLEDLKSREIEEKARMEEEQKRQHELKLREEEEQLRLERRKEYEKKQQAENDEIRKKIRDRELEEEAQQEEENIRRQENEARLHQLERIRKEEAEQRKRDDERREAERIKRPYERRKTTENDEDTTQAAEIDDSRVEQKRLEEEEKKAKREKLRKRLQSLTPEQQKKFYDLRAQRNKERNAREAGADAIPQK